MHIVAKKSEPMPGPNIIAGMTVPQVRRALARHFRDAGVESPELDARILVGHALALDHTALASATTHTIDTSEAAKIVAFADRRVAREPVARITGSKEFWGLDFRISPATLVPRPETETVVEAALAAIDLNGPRSRSLRIADLGTGTGAILLALLSELPNAFGIGTDIDTQALATARQNAIALGSSTRAAFSAGDFASALDSEFDLIVANPPYIASGEIAGLSPEVRCDPLCALDGGIDGLDAYRSIAAGTKRLLEPTGHLVLELGVDQAQFVAKLLQQEGFAPISLRHDLADTPRAITAGVATMPR
jgi:release factor glutamine methyltransferase